MTRYIDAELLKENFGKRLNNRFGISIKIDDAAVDLGLAIADTPTADVAEVVRCKDCEFKKLMSDGTTYACLKQTAYRKPTDFCSYGERKET